jgi:hypothetical protein
MKAWAKALRHEGMECSDPEAPFMPFCLSAFMPHDRQPFVDGSANLS